MKFATVTSTARNKSPLLRKLQDEQCWWVRFGDDLLLYGANNKFDSAVTKVARSVHDTDQQQGDIRKGDMHLVMQKGRTFQIENPKVRVILDKGRYLVVDLTKSKAAKLSKRQEPCFHIEPLRENTVAFETIARKKSARVSSQQETDLVSSLQAAAFEANLSKLVSFPTRLSTSTHYAEAAAWASKQFNDLGFSSSVIPITMPGPGDSSNVVAVKTGTGGQDKKNIIVGAHLDSVNHPGGPTAKAPGADDNASGSAGVLSLAAALANKQFKHDITFVLFGGEEQGLHGSTQYLASLSTADRAAVLGMLNMDMIGSVNASPPAVLLEGAAHSQSMIDGLVDSATAHTSLQIQISLKPFASDHMPFIEASIPAVLTIEGTDSANDAIHTGNDTIERIDINYAIEILRMNLGFIAAQAELVESLDSQLANDCSCSDSTLDASMAEHLRLVVGHYQGLFAQYSRLQCDGLISPDDFSHWQLAQIGHDKIANLLGGCVVIDS